MSVEACWTKIKMIIMSSMERNIPKVKIKQNKKTKAVMDEQ